MHKSSVRVCFGVAVACVFHYKQLVLISNDAADSAKEGVEKTAQAVNEAASLAKHAAKNAA